LAAEIRARFPEADVSLIPSKGGRFEVLSSGLPIFEKSKLGRKPKPGEVVQLLEATRR
jgi:predicted Rdx family selenoprotein